MLSVKIKFLAVKYFAKHRCPESFSLTSDEAKGHNFYETRIFFPDADYRQLEEMSSSEIKHCKQLYQFVPDKGESNDRRLIKGIKYQRAAEPSACYVSEHSLRYARIDVIYYYAHYQVPEKKCSAYTLIRLVTWRALRFIWLDITFSKLRNKYNTWVVSKRLRTPLKSKFEIYEHLMKNDLFLTSGNFRRSEIATSMLGNRNILDIKLHMKFSKSLDWILDACVEDGEIARVNLNEKNDNPLYRMKGKGVHYFTLTKEQIKNEEHHKEIQRNQVVIQNRMLVLTFLLVIATFMTAIDKFDSAWEIVVTVTDWFLNFLG